MTHKDILSMADDVIHKEFSARNACRVFCEEQRQKVEEIAQLEDIPFDTCIRSP